jgi:hypothetical protein
MIVLLTQCLIHEGLQIHPIKICSVLDMNQIHCSTLMLAFPKRLLVHYVSNKKHMVMPTLFTLGW